MFCRRGSERYSMKITKEDRFYFFLTFCLMFLIHGFCFTNLMYSHDSLFFYDTQSLWKIGIGRWLYPLVIRIRQFAAPWSVGLISSFFVAVSVVLVIRILELPRRSQNTSISILFAANITLVSLFCTFIFDGDADCIALFSACFAVFAFQYFPKYINLAAAVISLVISLALYQAYITVAIGLFLFLVMKKVYRAMDREAVIDTLKYGLKEIAVLFAAAVIYLIIMILLAKVTGVGFYDDYNSPAKVLNLTPVTVLELIPKCYGYFFSFFFRSDQFNNVFISIVNMVYFLFIAWVLLRAVIRSKREYAGRLFILIPCIVILPLGLNAFYVPASGEVHELMVYSFCLVYFLPFLFAEELEIPAKGNLQKALSIVPHVLIALLGLHVFVYGSGAYTYKKLVYDSSMEHAQIIWKDLMNLDGYEEGKTEVYFVGHFWASNTSYRNEIEKRYLTILNSTYPSSISYAGSIDRYFYGILGKNVNVVTGLGSLKRYPEVQAMPAYPLKGYCKMIGGTAVVKLK